VISPKGRAMTDALDAARQRLQGPILAKWSAQDRADLVRLMRRLADEALRKPGGLGA